MDNGIEIRTVEPEDEHLVQLIGKLDHELLERYPEEAVFGLDCSDPNIHEVVFAVAYMNGLPLGCGAIRPLDDESTELKRFFVEKSYRNRGIAAHLLAFLERRAQQLQFRTIRLETGAEQPEAIRFYRKHGYKEIDRFGAYVDCEASLCYEKHIR